VIKITKKAKKEIFYSDMPNQITVDGHKYMRFSRHYKKERAEMQQQRFRNMGLLCEIQGAKNLRGKIIEYHTYVTKKGKRKIQKPTQAQKGWKVKKTDSYLNTGKKGKRKGSFPAFFDEQTYIYYPKKKTIKRGE